MCRAAIALLGVDSFAIICSFSLGRS